MKTNMIFLPLLVLLINPVFSEIHSDELEQAYQLFDEAFNEYLIEKTENEESETLTRMPRQRIQNNEFYKKKRQEMNVPPKQQKATKPASTPTAIPKQDAYRAELKKIDAQMSLAYQDHAHIGEEVREIKEGLAHALKKAGGDPIAQRFAKAKAAKHEAELLDLKNTIEIIIRELKVRRERIVINMKQAALYQQTVPAEQIAAIIQQAQKEQTKPQEPQQIVTIAPAKQDTGKPQVLIVRRTQQVVPINRPPKHEAAKAKDHLQLDTSKIYEQNIRW